LRNDIQEYAKVLVVGAGGLECELLKDLALLGDVGKPKAEVAAKRVMERVADVNIVPHFCLIEDKELEFYNDFNIIVLEYDSDDDPREETVKPMVDGGTEGFKGHARVIIPGVTPCFECTIWLFPPQVNGKTFDPDNPEHMQWVYSESFFGIPGVAYSLTHIASGCSKTFSNYLTYNGVEGLHTKVTEFVKDKDCLVCGPGIFIELDASVTLRKPRVLLSLNLILCILLALLSQYRAILPPKQIAPYQLALQL
ncbi:NEDD8-activating enzyme E1 catalytic subunit, partial [Camellia lanceoleosa]